jgi:FKBP-type peptidyl-prolyl cis-trans isomerase SlyD
VSQIAENKVVSIDYKLQDDEGRVLDSSEGREPLQYLHGKGNIIPGLEQALTGREVGEEVKVDVPPEEAYGQRDPQLVQSVSKSLFQGVEKIQPGMQFQAQTPEGNRVVTVVDVAEEEVKIDANHPLAGQTLHFDVAVRDVREATPEEQQAGRANGTA